MPGVYFGVVVDTKDPESLGRVKVSLPDFTGDINIEWIRVAQPLASSGYGALVLPEIDDQVVVLQGPGGVNGMVVIGSLYSGTRAPLTPDADGKNNIKQVVTRTGNEITIDDTDGAEMITIQTVDAGVSIVFDSANKKLAITGTEEVKIVSDTAVILESDAITITGNSTIEVAGGDVTISGDSIKLDSSSVDIAP